MLVNDIPVELSGVTRLTCQALLREFPHSASVRRVMNHWESTERCNHELARSSSQINSKTKHDRPDFRVALLASVCRLKGKHSLHNLYTCVPRDWIHLWEYDL